MSDTTNTLADLLLASAGGAALPVYEKTMCGNAGCCGDIEGAIREAVVVTLRTLADDAERRSAEFNAHELRIEADEVESQS